MKNGKLLTVPFVIALLVLAISAAGFGRVISAYGIHLRKLAIQPSEGRLVSAIPHETESWVQLGADQMTDAEVLETLGTTNQVSRVYVLKGTEGPQAKAINFHAAYYTGMIDTVPHVPERCFVGGGLQKSSASVVLDLPVARADWVEDESVPEQFRGPLGAIYTAPTSWQYSDRRGLRVRMPRGVGPDEPVRMMVSEFRGEGGVGLYAGYFFVANGGTVASAEGVRTLAFDLTSDYAYYLKVQTTSSTVESKEELMELSSSLVGELMPEIMRCVPDWVDVQKGVYPEDNPRRSGGAEQG